MIFMMPYCTALQKLGLLGRFTTRAEKEFLNERGRYMYASDKAPVSAAVSMFKVILSKKAKAGIDIPESIVKLGVLEIRAWAVGNMINKEESKSAIDFIDNLSNLEKL